MSVKRTIIKGLDLAGMSFLTPVVRLCTWEEPAVQVKAIGRFIVTPIAAFLVFVALWAWIAPHHKTKSGEVPTPGVVWDAARGIWTFHRREGEKLDAYTAEGRDRAHDLAWAEARLSELDELEKEADRQVAAERASMETSRAKQLAPLDAAYEAERQRIEAAQAARKAELADASASLPQGDDDRRLELLVSIKSDRELIDQERAALATLRSELDDARSAQAPALATALTAQTAVAEEKQYLSKLVELLSTGNRSQRVGAAEKALETKRAEYLAAAPDRLHALGTQVIQAEERLEAARQSQYAKPWTLPDQILRSLTCVFFGFLLGTAIAVPIGVLCGLSPTFMAAMTPFIALFRPVSPIVWLPIALIIVGGFIPDPDGHWLMRLLAEMPLIGWLKINPAFIASGLTVALCSLWPTLVNTALGVASIDKDHINVARVLQLTWTQRLLKIVIPSALPLIFAGLRISLGVGWMVLIAAELLAGSEGIGKAVWDMFNNGSSQTLAQMFVVVFVVGLIGLLLDRVMIVLQRMVSFGEPAVAAA